MNSLIYALAPLVLATSASAPPHAPNFCGQEFCLELQPMLNSERRGFVEIEKDMVEIDGRSWIIFKYDDLGKVSVIGPFPVDLKNSDLSINETGNAINVTSCFDKNNPASCGRYIITVDDNEAATKPLICSIVSFWLSRPKPNSPDVELGERLSEQCL